MSSEINRRFFIRHVLNTAGGLAASSLLASCSTLDEYLFEDHFFLKDQVLIIGGGLSGLSLAYHFKKNKTEFRLFEGSNRFGGRIRSSQNGDFGASIYSPQDHLMCSLVKELSLPFEKIDSDHLFIPSGMQTLTNQLVERISGLMPYRSLRLQWKLVSIQKVNAYYELVFETPRGRRTFVSRRVALALPPSQWSSIAGLADLEEMKEARQWLAAMKPQNIVKASFGLPNSDRPYRLNKNVNFFEEPEFNIRQINKKSKSQTWTEIDFIFKQPSASSEIEKLNDFIKRKMSININFNKLKTENYFDWRSTSLIQAAYFKSAVAWPDIKSPNFYVIGDFATNVSPHSIEGALLSAQKTAETIL